MYYLFPPCRPKTDRLSQTWRLTDGVAQDDLAAVISDRRSGKRRSHGVDTHSDSAPVRNGKPLGPSPRRRFARRVPAFAGKPSLSKFHPGLGFGGRSRLLSRPGDTAFARCRTLTPSQRVCAETSTKSSTPTSTPLRFRFRFRLPPSTSTETSTRSPTHAKVRAAAFDPGTT